jgi:[acyl-carrier-protein] S-malonyltransferase
LNQPDKLATTAFSQPAILVTQLATATCQADKIGAAITATAGFSLGEYSALIHAGALTLEDGVRLVAVRAVAMQQAAEESSGGMVTVVGLSDEKLEGLCRDAAAACALPANAALHNMPECLQVANHLFPSGRVLSGHASLVAWAVAHAAEPKYGAQAATKLGVAGAFHSPYMQPARSALQAALNEVPLQLPNVPCYSNVTAQPYASVDEIRTLLVQQLESPVRWEQTIKAMLATGGVSSFVDAGPGMQLKSMIRRIHMPSFKSTVVLDV